MADTPKKTSKSGISATKEGGYAAQKRYRANHPDRVKAQNAAKRGVYYEPKIRIPSPNKRVLEKLLNDTGLSITELFVGAVEEKYGVVLSKIIDN